MGGGGEGTAGADKLRRALTGPKKKNNFFRKRKGHKVPSFLF